MGMFDSKEDKTSKLMEKYGLSDLPPQYADTVKVIAQELAGMGLQETGLKLSFAKSEEQLKISYLHAIFEQNWIIMGI